MNALLLTKEKLYEALLQWETANRNGELLSAEAAAELPLEQVARLSTELLWKLLTPEGL
jgi:hypothetical protein